MNFSSSNVSWHHLVAGALARSTTALLLSPLDVIKARLQFQGNLTQINTFSSPFHAFSQILRKEGPSAFFNGIGPRLLYTVPSASVSFFFYEHFHRFFQKARREQSDDILSTSSTLESFSMALAPLFAGAVARVFGTAARTPFDIIKQRMQIKGSFKKQLKLSSSLEMFSHVVKTEGLSSLWSGYRVTLLRDAPFAALYFFNYEIFKTLQEEWFHNFGVYNHLASGALAGSLASLITFPIDTVKTRLQSQNMLLLLHPETNRRYQGISHAFSTIIKEEGFNSLYKGASLRVFYISLAASITFASYEFLKELLNSSYPSNVS